VLRSLLSLTLLDYNIKTRQQLTTIDGTIVVNDTQVIAIFRYKDKQLVLSSTANANLCMEKVFPVFTDGVVTAAGIELLGTDDFCHTIRTS